jgi:hypothetical protein
LSIEVGLDKNTNYYVSTNPAIQRNGFRVVPSIGRLTDEISVAVKGQVQATITADLLGGLGDLYMKILISDINSTSRDCTLLKYFLVIHTWIDFPSQTSSFTFSHLHLQVSFRNSLRQLR